VTSPALAAVLSTGDPERLYAGLSVLVSTAVDGEPCAALAAFGALALILDPDVEGRLTHVTDPETFARSLAELIETAVELESLTIHACAASVQTMGLDSVAIGERLDGVKSTPRFLRDTAGARLIFV
jgi:peroxiredoxin family protein